MNLEQPAYPDPRKLEQFKTNHALAELRRAIHYGRVRCLSAQEVTEKICRIEPEDDPIDYIKRLQEFKLTDADFEYLADRLTDLATRSEKANAHLTIRIDRTILRCVRLLPTELAS